MLDTTRLVLRAFKPDDWPDLHQYLSDSEVVYYEPYEPFSEKNSQEEAIYRAKNPDFIAVCRKEDNRVIGNVYLQQNEYNTWVLGYVFNRLYHRQGYATEAVRRSLDWVFTERLAHRVIALCNPENVRSWRLLERLKFRREGMLRKNIFFKLDPDGNPIWQDTFEYAILAEEWID